MRVPSPMCLAALTLLVGGLACAKNNPDETVGAARDTTTTGISDSANARQDQSGVTDSSGESTLGKDVTRTRPDQGQPVTSKGDTINAGVDSATAPTQPTTPSPSDSQAAPAPTPSPSSDSVVPRSDTTSSVSPSADSMNMKHGADSSSTNDGANSATVNTGADSATTGVGVDSTSPSADTSTAR